MELTELQRTICERAKWLLEDRGIYKICLDKIMSDQEILKDEQAAVMALVDDTMYWEGKFG